MTKAAAIAAQLVDVRNVNTHKCVRMTIDVPAEQAMMVVEAFGWPTQVNPVPVAIARLNLGSSSTVERHAVNVDAAGSSPASSAIDTPVKPRKPVAAEKRLAQQAGILCADPVFQMWIAEFTDHRRRMISEDDAAILVRELCDVSSRSEIVLGSPAGNRWLTLESQFTAWKLAT